MGHQQNRHTFVTIQMRHGIQQFARSLGIKRAGWFITKKNIRLLNQCPSCGYPLFLTAGKFGWVMIQHVFNAKRLRDLINSFGLLFSADILQGKWQCNVFPAG